jgi:hypothetical protein
MRFVGVLGLALGRMSVIAAVAAYGETSTRSSYEGATAAVVGEKGHLRVPADYRTAYQMLGTWAIAKDDVHRLQDGLSGLSCAGTTVRLDLHGRLPGPGSMSGLI